MCDSIQDQNTLDRDLNNPETPRGAGVEHLKDQKGLIRYQNLTKVGDMWLNEDQLPPGMRNGEDPIRGESAGRRDTKYRWPDKTLLYQLSDDLSRWQKGTIEWTLHNLEKKLGFHGPNCVKFRASSSSDAVLVSSTDSCSSSVGYQGSGGGGISLGKGCYSTGIVEHEFLHALGVYHTHTRPDRDKYVTVHFENIQEDKKHNFKKRSNEQASTFGVPYDFDSVMHYSDREFSKNGLKTIVPVIEPINCDGITCPNCKIGQRFGVSICDIELVRKMYEC